MSSYAAAQGNAGPWVESQSVTALFRATGALPDEAIEAIADWTLPEENQIIPAKVSPEDFITRRCGHRTNTYMKLFARANPGLQFRTELQDRSVTVPPCAYWRKDVEVEVAAGDTLEKIVLREMDRTPSDHLFKDCPATSKSIRCGTIEEVIRNLNPGVDFSGALKPGIKLTLPNVTRSVVLRLDPKKFDGEPAPTASDSTSAVTDRRIAIQKLFESKINAIIDQALGEKSKRVTTATTNVLAGDVSIVKPLSADEVRDESCREAANKRTDWPFDVERVRVAIDRMVVRLKNKRVPIATEKQLPSNVIIRVVDAGFVDYDHDIPERFRYLDITQQNGSPFRDGIVVDDSENLASFPEYYEYHGIRVANLDLGGIKFGPSLTKIDLPIQLQLVKAARNIGSRVNSKYECDRRTLTDSFAYKPFTPPVGVINFSLATLEEKSLNPILSAIRGAPEGLLIVAAAGNDHSDLADTSLYPAALGGKRRGPGGNNVISVGASDADHKLAEFSNWGPELVDLLAPGCDMHYQTREGDRSENGTSFAAPLVSFTAAVLQSFGLQTAVEVKQRILVSVDYSDQLKDKVVSGGVLNIEKAVSLSDSVLQDQNGQISYLTWNRELKLCKDDEDTTDPDRLRKITTVRRGSALLLRYLKMDKSGMLLDAKECEPGEAGIGFLENGVKPWSEILDFVPGDKRFMVQPQPAESEIGIQAGKGADIPPGTNAGDSPIRWP